MCGKICDENNIKLSQVEKIGIGVPGTVDSENGMIMFACNLNFNKVSIKERSIEEKCGVSVKILNDAMQRHTVNMLRREVRRIALFV